MTSTQARNVFLNLSKGQNTLHTGPKRPFESVKGKKRMPETVEMSFIGVMKDKSEPPNIEMSFIGQMKDKMQARDRENVLHRVDEGQNASPRP